MLSTISSGLLRTENNANVDDSTLPYEMVEDSKCILRTVRSLGAGGSSVVVLAELDDDREQLFAVKVILKEELTSVQLRRVVAEYNRLWLVRSIPQLIQLVRVIEDPRTINIVMNYASGGDLYSCMTQNYPLGMPETQVRLLFRQCCEGVAALHRMGLVHRDIKCENILLSADHSRIFISDLGLSTYSRSNGSDSLLGQSYCGTLYYASPEVICHEFYNGFELDVWALGVVLFILLTARMPFYETSEHLTRKKICNGDYACPSHFKPSFLLDKLLYGMFRLSLADRFTISDVLQSEWLNYEPISRWLTTTLQWSDTKDAIEESLDLIDSGWIPAVSDSRVLTVDPLTATLLLNSTRVMLLDFFAITSQFGNRLSEWLKDKFSCTASEQKSLVETFLFELGGFFCSQEKFVEHESIFAAISRSIFALHSCGWGTVRMEHYSEEFSTSNIPSSFYFGIHHHLDSTPPLDSSTCNSPCCCIIIMGYLCHRIGHVLRKKVSVISRNCDMLQEFDKQLIRCCSCRIIVPKSNLSSSSSSLLRKKWANVPNNSAGSLSFGRFELLFIRYCNVDSSTSSRFYEVGRAILYSTSNPRNSSPLSSSSAHRSIRYHSDPRTSDSNVPQNHVNRPHDSIPSNNDIELHFLDKSL